MTENEAERATVVVATPASTSGRRQPYYAADVTRYTLSTTPTVHRFEHLPDRIIIDTTGSADSVRVCFGATMDQNNYLLVAANKQVKFYLRTEFLALRGDSGSATAVVIGLRYD